MTLFFWISLVVLIAYGYNGWTTIGPGLLFCLMCLIAEVIYDLARVMRDGIHDIVVTMKRSRHGR